MLSIHSATKSENSMFQKGPQTASPSGTDGPGHAQEGVLNTEKGGLGTGGGLHAATHKDELGGSGDVILAVTKKAPLG